MRIAIDHESRTVSFDGTEVPYSVLYKVVVEVMKASGAAYFEDWIKNLN